MQDFLEPFRTHIEESKDPFEKHIFMWCVENYVPLQQFDEKDMCVICYERICTAPLEQLKALLGFLNKPFSDDISRTLDKPSAVSRPDSAILTGGSLIDSWRKTISTQQVTRAIEILKLFGLNRVYDESSMPLITAKYPLSSFRSD